MLQQMVTPPSPPEGEAERLLRILRQVSAQRYAVAQAEQDDLVSRIRGLMTELTDAQQELEDVRGTADEDGAENSLAQIRQELEQARTEERAAADTLEYALSLRGQVVALEQIGDITTEILVADHQGLLEQLEVDLSCCPNAQSLMAAETVEPSPSPLPLEEGEFFMDYGGSNKTVIGIALVSVGSLALLVGFLVFSKHPSVLMLKRMLGLPTPEDTISLSSGSPTKRSTVSPRARGRAKQEMSSLNGQRDVERANGGAHADDDDDDDDDDEISAVVRPRAKGKKSYRSKVPLSDAGLD